MTLTEINNMLNKESVYWGSCGYEDVELKFDITPHSYLEFMEEDLKDSDQRSLINALSNAKRALDCQIESLLYVFCLKSFTDKKKMRIPGKIELLNKLGIIAPRILNKINKIRNIMEHEFYCPNIDEVQDFADVILLFISYTDKYLYYVKSDCEIFDDENNIFFTTDFDREKQNVIIDVIESGKERTIVTIEANDESVELFINFLKLYLGLVYTNY